MIMMYKVTHNLVALPPTDYITYSRTHTRRSNPYKIQLAQATIDALKFSFFPRSSKAWNTLASTTVTAETVDQFKAGLAQEYAH